MSNRGTVVGDDGISQGLSADEAFAVLPQVLDALASAPWWQWSSEQLAERIQILSRAENQIVSAQVSAVGEGISRGLPALAGCKTGGAWLRALVPLTPSAATQRAGLAQELPGADLAPTREAFAAGSIALGHANVVFRTMTALAAVPEVDGLTWGDAQRLLVDCAGRLDPAQLGRAGLHLRHRLDPQGPERLAQDEQAQHAARFASLHQERSGMWFLTASLPALDGAMLAATLDVLAAPRPAKDGGPDRRTGQQRMADAVVGLAELSLAQRGGDRGALPSRHGSPVRLHVTGELAALLADPTVRHGQAGVAPARVETGQPGGWDLSPLSFQMLACDAEIVPVLLDGSGRPLDVGESVYRFPPRIRRAIEIRDTHCTFGTCQAPPTWCHAHHLTPFGRGGKPGGPTSEANGTLLCGFHHRFVHSTGWTGTLIDGHVRWRPPGAGEARPDGSATADEVSNTPNRQFESKLRQLALRWIARNPDLHNTS